MNTLVCSRGRKNAVVEEQHAVTRPAVGTLRVELFRVFYWWTLLLVLAIARRRWLR